MCLARDIHDLPPSVPASSTQLQSNLVEKNMYRGTKRFSVRAVSERVGALLGAILSRTARKFGRELKDSSPAAGKASSVFLRNVLQRQYSQPFSRELSGNLVFMCAFWSWLTAQTMKYFTAFYREGNGTGGSCLIPAACHHHIHRLSLASQLR